MRESEINLHDRGDARPELRWEPIDCRPPRAEDFRLPDPAWLELLAAIAVLMLSLVAVALIVMTVFVQPQLSFGVMMSIAGFALFTLLGVALLQGAVQTWRKVRFINAHNNRCCFECGFDLRMSRDRCPECGRPFDFTQPFRYVDWQPHDG